MIPADEPHCRIGKVHLRNGASVRVIDQNSMRSPESEVLRREVVEKAQFFSDSWPDIAGYAMFVWDSRGFWSTTYRVGLNSPYPSIAVPVLASEGLREDMTTNSAVSWINRQLHGSGPNAT